MCENTDSSRTTTRSRPRAPLSISGLSRFLLPTFLCGKQRKVGAAPHRGNANRPLTKQGKARKPEQGKAKAPGTLTNKRPASNKLKKTPRRRQTTQQAPGKPKSHYMNQTFTYWRFPKNRPTIQPNTHREQKSPRPATARKKPETKPNHAKAPKAATACPRQWQHTHREQIRPPLRPRAVSAKNYLKANRHEQSDAHSRRKRV
ncbi:hypothetical protein LMG24238_07064 [Paraburkholderia sediminicola]|uniref:Uncharacterized protein n=1 Tax=Paraburkholderia sediminicola TaxID=458836 RepID=A0A6J5CS34_9BURK|nr:hypothetical protein LMG24238_07064 [Paraburkholderia sediminicola]